MRPIPAPRIGDSHGLLRAIEQRGRLRTDEFVTEFTLEQLFPPDLENALGRMRHFISYARSAGLVKEDRGIVELTDVGKRYVRAGDEEAPYDVSPQQSEWLRRQLREKHMTDSIFHGLAIGLSLLASRPPDRRVSTLDFGRSLAYLGRAGWDNENTFQIQGERYLVLLGDMELIDAEHRLTATGELVRGELTLPVHMSLLDIAAQLNPGGAAAVRAEAEAEWAEPAEPSAVAPGGIDTGEYQDVGPGAWSPPAPAATNGEGAILTAREPSGAAPAPAESVGPPPAPAEAVGAPPAPGEGGPGAAAATRGEGASPPASPAGAGPPSAGPPVPPADVWETAGPEDATRAIPSVRPPIVPRASDAGVATPPSSAPRAVDTPTVITPTGTPTPPRHEETGPPTAPGGALPTAAPEPAVDRAASEAGPTAGPESGVAPGGGGIVAVPGEAVTGAPQSEADASRLAAPAGGVAPGEAAPDAGGIAALPGGELRGGGGGFLDPAAIQGAAEAAGLRLPAGVYASVAAALGAGKHVLLTGAPGAGKTALALAVARAAAHAGRARGATLVTARHRWADEELLVDSAKRGRWVIVDELDRARLDRALGSLSSFLSGLPVLLPSGEEAEPDAGWRIVATADAVPRASAALLRRFAVVAVPPPPREALEGAVHAAAGGEPTVVAAIRRLLPLAELTPLGAGVFLDAARHAAARHAAAPTDVATLAREAFAAYVAPLTAQLDEDGQRRVRAALDES